MGSEAEEGTEKEQKSCIKSGKNVQAIFPSEGVTLEVPLTVRYKEKLGKSKILSGPMKLSFFFKS